MAFQGTDRFEVLGLLGQGGMGVVYEAYDHVRGMRVALKTLRRVSATRLLRFKREFRTLSQLVHPNIITLYELVAEGSELFFTMELIDGQDLLSYVRETRPAMELADVTLAGGDRSRAATQRAAGASARDPASTRAERAETERTSPERAETERTRPDDLPPTQTMSGAREVLAADGRVWFQGAPAAAAVIPAAERVALDTLVDLERLRDALAQLVSALQVLHAAGLVHRDLKPSNVLVTREGRVVLMDFGLVADVARPRMLTVAGALHGTPGFMAPEQARGEEPTAAADWYAFGGILYELLTGRLPYHEGDVEQVLWAKQAFDPPPPGAFTRGIPRTLEHLCLRLLARAPAQRPDGDQVRAALGMDSAAPAAGTRSADTRSGELFVGRARELDILGDAYRAVRAGSMRCMVVEGPSGMGKSSLVERFAREAGRTAPAGAQPLVLTGRCHERESLPYKAFDAVLDQLSYHLLALPAAARRALLPGGMPLLARLFPVLRRVPGAEGAVTLAGMAPEQLRGQAARALHALLAGLARARPVIVRIDDLQWADGSSLDLLLELLQGPAIEGLLWLTTVRSEPLDTADQSLSRFLVCLDALPVCARIALAPLSVDEQHALVLGMIDAGRAADRAGHAAGRRATTETPLGEATIDDRLIARLLQEASGHPLLLAELVRHSLETPAGLELGPQLRLEDVIWRRITHLPEQARALLSAVAFNGEPAPLDVLADAAALPPADRERALAVLDQARLARLLRSGSELWLDVYHDKVREAVMARVPAEPARRLHGQLARAMEAWPRAPVALRARHWLAAGAREQAVHYLMEAARGAAAQLAHDSAAALYRTVVEVLGGDAGDARLGPWLCRAWIGLVEGMRLVDRGREALSLLDRAQAVARAHGLVEELADIHSLRGNLLFPRGDIDGCLNEHRLARALARRAGSSRREARALSGLGDAHYMRGHMITAYAHYDRCIDLCRAHGLVDVEAANLSMRGLTRFHQNDFAAALRDGAGAVALAGRVGHLRAEINARCNCLSLVWIERGRMDRARRELETARALARELGARRFESASLLFLGRLLAMQGRRGEARRQLERGLTLCRETGLSYVGPIALGALALVTDSAELRRQAVDEAENILRAGTASHNYLYFYRDVMDMALEAGDHEAVERYAGALARYTRAEPLPWSDFFIDRARALSAHMRGVRDTALGAELVRLHDQAMRVGFHMAAVALGQALARAG